VLETVTNRRRTGRGQQFRHAHRVVNHLERNRPEKQKPAEGRALHTGLTGEDLFGKPSFPEIQTGRQAVIFR